MGSFEVDDFCTEDMEALHAAEEEAIKPDVKVSYVCSPDTRVCSLDTRVHYRHLLA